ncbi:hypothetical protein LTS18_004636, partial [Coniosporium uncinatum]
VVLDEAQAIKNHKSATSRSCRQLDAKHRWALSGTPIQNTLSELYPYFKFLHVPHTGSFRVFKQNFIDGNSPDQLDRLMAFLKRFMIRRTHLDEMFGAPLLQLPKATEKRTWLEFNDFERGVYQIVYRRMVSRINSFARRDQLERNYSNILTMFLRLRQMTSHILMVEYVMRDLLEREDHEKLRELADYEAQKSRLPVRSAQIAQLRASLKSVEDEIHINKRPTRDGESQVDGSVAGDQADSAGPSQAQSNRSSGSPSGPAKASVGKHHGLNYEFQQYLRDLQRGKQWDELQRRTVCARCGDRPENPWYTSCYHVYCHFCLTELEQDAIAREADSRCFECGDLYFKSWPCKDLKVDGMSPLNGDSSDSDRETAYMKPKGKKGKGKTAKEKDWIDMAGANVLPSAKTIAIKAQILNWVAENPKVKIIVYSQFVPMIRVLSKMCQAEKWGHVMYHGGMNTQQRENVIKDFSKSDTANILIASLKCGGIGLNLTMASKVICVDPWWNDAVEQQAFCRVFRIGQNEPTHLTRLVVRKTVDEQMVNMQLRKQEEIDQIMGQDSKHRRKLSTRDLMRLFGDVEEDQDGKPFILVEDKETLPMIGGGSDDGLGDDD